MLCEEAVAGDNVRDDSDVREGGSSRPAVADEELGDFGSDMSTEGDLKYSRE